AETLAFMRVLHHITGLHWLRERGQRRRCPRQCLRRRPGRVKATKTYEERTVDVTPELVRALAQHMTWLKAEGLRRGWGEPDGLFPKDEGSRTTRRGCGRSSSAHSGRPCSRPSASTTSATPSHRCSWPRARRSPTSPRNSGT